MSSRPVTPKGHRPYDLGDPHTERVLGIVMALATEVAVMHDQYDTLARVASSQPTFSLQDLEDYRPSLEVMAERDAWRKAYLGRLMRILYEAVPEDRGAGEAYARFVDEIS
jgi:hypothetical protein